MTDIIKRHKKYIIAAAGALVLGLGLMLYEDQDWQKLTYELVPTKDVDHTPFIPDVSAFNTDTISQMVPPFKEGKIVLDNINNYPEFSEFLEDEGPRQLRLAQHRVNPRAIIVQSGDYDLGHVYEIVKTLTMDDIIVKQGNKYLLRVPLMVAAGASLNISNVDADEIRLSKEKNAFIVNAGKLFILRTRVVGWSEEKKGAAKFADKLDYRPFITTWDASELYIASSRLESLGYLNGKSYGLSYSTCTACLKLKPNMYRPTGAVVDSYFSDMFYGFYSYEADDVAIVGNTYDGNVIYGVDPHDRSRRLIIARNDSFKAHKKHGIIVSREVNDSYIFDNKCHDNKGSGIMIDRSSVNNLIANNELTHNDGDGITFFESQNNKTWNNKIFKNKRDGIRVRNSWDVVLASDDISMNNGAAIEVYSQDITKYEHRDIVEDPFTQRANVAVYDPEIRASGSSVFKMQDAEHLTLGGIKLRSGTHLFPGNDEYNEPELLSLLGKKDSQIVIKAQSTPSALVNYISSMQKSAFADELKSQ